MIDFIMRQYPFTHKTLVALLALLMLSGQSAFMLHSASHIHHDEAHSLSTDTQSADSSVKLHANSHHDAVYTHLTCLACAAHLVNGSASMAHSNPGIPHLTTIAPIQSDVDSVVSPHLGNYLSRAPPA